jgi:hypothetical protein
MAHTSRRDEDPDLDRDLRELRLAVGLEERETTNHGAANGAEGK